MKNVYKPLIVVLLSVWTLNIHAQTTTINFDTAENWTKGSAALSSYASDHQYSEAGATFTGGPALRNGTTTQDGFGGAIGTYSWRLSNSFPMEWITTIATGGVSTFSYKIRRWDGTPSPNFNLEYSVNGGTNWTIISVVNNDLLNNTSDWVVVNGTINSEVDNVKIRLIANAASERIMIDDFTWSVYGDNTVLAPASLTATTVSSSEITISTTKNINSDNLLIAYSTNGVFGDPVDGTTYSAGQSINGGGTIVSTGSTSSMSHTSLDGHTSYHYKAWSVNAENKYSTGITATATTLGSTPDQSANNLVESSKTYSSIDLGWNYTQGTNTADGILILASTTNNLIPPTDGVWYSNDTDLSDGAGSMTVTSDVTSYEWTGLTPETTYYFAVYAFANNQTDVKYNISSTTNKAQITTAAIPSAPIVWINEFHYDNISDDTGEMVEVVLKDASSYTSSDIVINLYNGGNGESYGSHALNTFTEDTTYGDYTFYYKMIAGIQNGAPDGFAISYQGTLIENSFISYEGEFTATKGPATDVTSVNVGLSESGTNPIGTSIQLSGTALLHNQFTWTTASASPGKLNANQYFGVPNQWTGTVSSSWTEANNWSQGVPSTDHVVTIPSVEITNFPILEAPTSIQKLILESDAQLFGQEFLSSTLGVTVKREFILSESNTNLRWTYFVSPFQDTRLLDYINQNKSIDLYAAIYHKDDDSDIQNDWNLSFPKTDTLLIGEAVALAAFYDATENSAGGTAVADTFCTMALEGNLHTSANNLSTKLTKEGNNGWNLIGNPYLAPIDWSANSWNYSSLQSTVAYVYKPSNGTYSHLLSDGSTIPTGGSTLIAPMQGFFVDATSNNLIIPKNARQNQKTMFLKSAKNNSDVVISISGNNYTDETIIQLNTAASNGFQQGDARKLLAVNPNLPQIGTLADGELLVLNQIQSYPIDIPVVLKQINNQSIELKFKGIESISDEYQVILIDENKNQKYDLRQQTSIQLSGTTPEMQLIFKIDLKSGISKFEDGFQIFAKDEIIRITNSQLKNAQIRVCDVMGRLLHLTKLNEASQTTIDMAGMKGIFFVTIDQANNRFTRKVILQ